MKRLIGIPAILLVLAATLASAQTASTQVKLKKIVVTGSSEMEVEPDQIYVNFVLKEFNDNKKQKVGIETINKEFLASCEKAGVAKENIRVEGMAGNAYDEWFIRKKKKDPEFMATITYIILFASTKGINDLVPMLNDEAVVNMYISKMSHSRLEAIRKEVKIKATQAAREKAAYLAESIGEKIGSALLIEEVSQDGSPYPMMLKSNEVMNMESAPAYGGETSMPFEKIKIRFETRGEFELL